MRSELFVQEGMSAPRSVCHGHIFCGDVFVSELARNGVIGVEGLSR